ncbi:hypothetical protein LPJ71_003304, partial [Coemansia sp. S17]
MAYAQPASSPAAQAPAAGDISIPNVASLGFKHRPVDFEEELHFKFWNPLHYYKALNQHRMRLNLPNPGQFEMLNREVKGTMLTNF